MSERVLYWGSGSVPCWKPMLVLAEKGLKYDSKMISFSEKGHKGPEVMALNPRGQAPTFKDGENVVNESNAICFYLETKYPNEGKQLLPADDALRAKVLQKAFEEQLQQKLQKESCYKKGTTMLFRSMFTTEEYEGRSMTGQGNRPALENQEKLEVLKSMIKDKWPSLQMVLVRQVITHLLKPSKVNKTLKSTKEKDISTSE